MSGPRLGSRYTGATATRNERGAFVLSSREPYRYREHPDNRTHVVVQGDTLFHLAGVYFAPLPRACGYWWAIADYQPEPIVDPTLELEVGRALVIPSIRVLTEHVLSLQPRSSA